MGVCDGLLQRVSVAVVLIGVEWVSEHVAGLHVPVLAALTSEGVRHVDAGSSLLTHRHAA